MSLKKRQKLDKYYEIIDHEYEIIDHEYGILPSGNLLLNPTQTPAKSKLGTFLTLQDQQIIDLLEVLGPVASSKLGMTCRALYVFSNHEDLWRSWTLSTFKGTFSFKKNWKTTFAIQFTIPEKKEFVSFVPIKVPHFYSDLLYTSWRCATCPLKDLVNPSKENIDRRSNLSFQDFMTLYALPQKPVILTDVVSTWPAFSKWNLDFFASRATDQLYRAESVDMTFQKYLDYMNQAKEESPLYLFDKFSLKNDPELSNDYKVPEYFDQDLFQVLGQEDRPDYRWIIIGPERSGSTFHIDPNATCAWNAVISGSKKWILTPPHQPPPGVFPSKDGSEVTCPVSVAEWYLNHYHQLEEAQEKGEMTVYEAVCKPGEMIFVPAKYWHSVMNLQEGIALTQNFVSSYNLQQVLEFARFKPDQVSGYQGTLFSSFSENLARLRPDEWDKVNQERLVERKSKWEKLTDPCLENLPGSLFNFDIQDQEDEDVDGIEGKNVDGIEGKNVDGIENQDNEVEGKEYKNREEKRTETWRVKKSQKTKTETLLERN